MIQNTIEQYNAELAAFISKFTKRTEHLPKASAAEVAETIFGAATDNRSKSSKAKPEMLRFILESSFLSRINYIFYVAYLTASFLY